MWGDFSAAEREQLGEAYFRYGAEPCPRCGGELRFHEHGWGTGRKTAMVIIVCERCQLRASFEGAEAADPWAPEEVETLRQHVREYGAASCPRDDARLKIVRSQTIGSQFYFGSCPLCGRSFKSA